MQLSVPPPAEIYQLKILITGISPLMGDGKDSVQEGPFALKPL
jgi:hypothetical protein